jgi:predicted Ser/Thr protein kinase
VSGRDDPRLNEVGEVAHGWFDAIFDGCAGEVVTAVVVEFHDERTIAKRRHLSHESMAKLAQQAAGMSVDGDDHLAITA